MASKRRLRRNACGKKKRYGSAAEALSAIKALTRAPLAGRATWFRTVVPSVTAAFTLVTRQSTSERQ